MEPLDGRHVALLRDLRLTPQDESWLVVAANVHRRCVRIPAHESLLPSRLDEDDALDLLAHQHLVTAQVLVNERPHLAQAPLHTVVVLIVNGLAMSIKLQLRKELLPVVAARLEISVDLRKNRRPLPLPPVAAVLLPGQHMPLVPLNGTVNGIGDCGQLICERRHDGVDVRIR